MKDGRIMSGDRIEAIFDAAQKERCRDCGYLVEDEAGRWICDDCGKEIWYVTDGDCSANQNW